MAYQFIITHRQKKKDRGFCANLKCRAPLEPPIYTYTFQLENHPKTFQRQFCVDCIRRIKRARKHPIWFEVLEI